MAIIEIEAPDGSLAQLVERAASGEEIVLSSAGVPQARLVPIARSTELGGKRKLGALAGLGKVPEDFDDPLPADILTLFEGR